MKEDFKIFIKYIFSVKGFITRIKEDISSLLKPKNLSYMFLLSVLWFFLKKEVLLSIFLLILAFVLQLRVQHQAGDHTHWWRIKQGIKKPKEMKYGSDNFGKKEMEFNEESNALYEIADTAVGEDN